MNFVPSFGLTHADSLPGLLNVVLLGCKSNPRIPSYFDPHPQDILGLEGSGVLEGGMAPLALRPPFSERPF